MIREHRALNAILEPGGITPFYQPILDMKDTPRVAAFECLSRGPKGTNFESAKVLFEYVRLKREETLVDRACCAAALAHAPKHAPLSLNVHASTLGRDYDFTEFLCATASAQGIACNAITVEIIEHAPPWDSIGFAAALDRLRAAGMRIALDDVGLGQSNFKMILDVRPDYLKVDRYFVDECDTDPHRRAVIAALTALASHFGAEVVAEGVASEGVVEALRGLGVRYMQGHFFAEAMSAKEAAGYAIP